MGDPGVAQRRLAERLKELRLRGKPVPLTQRQIAAALGTSVALVSSWENGNAVPPVARIKAYALLFAAPRSFEPAGGARAGKGGLTTEEEGTRQRLDDELMSLREEAATGSARRQAGALGGRFWHFPDGGAVRIITTQMWTNMISGVPYADRRHPNYIESLNDADRDATIEVFGHIRAENPMSDVRFLTSDQVSQDDLSEHVVVLGQGDLSWGPLSFFARRLELPVTVHFSDDDREFGGEFVVTTDAEGKPAWFPRDRAPDGTEVYRPRFSRDFRSGEVLRVDGIPILECDVALLARMPNQLNLSRTVTIATGIFSRGTYGAVRALTDASLRSRNELYLMERFGGLDNFWALFYVPVMGVGNPSEELTALETLTPDLTVGDHRLRLSR
jgi:transcriptional regulator with XRE-family HTH domain